MRHLLLATPFALLATPAAASTGEPVNPWVALAYLISGVFFILALRGLSSPATSRTGNRFGMVGMLIAVVTTLVTHFPWVTEQQLSDVFVTRPDWASMSEILIAIAIGAIIGITIARRAGRGVPQPRWSGRSAGGLGSLSQSRRLRAVRRDRPDRRSRC